LGEALVLREESVSGMDGIAPGDECRRDHRRRLEIRTLCLGRADADGFDREPDRQRLAVGFAVRDDGLDPESAARPKDAEGDLAPVGDEHLLYHKEAPI